MGSDLLHMSKWKLQYALSCLSCFAVSSAPLQLRLTRGPGHGARQQRRLQDADEARVYGNIHTYMAFHVDVLVGTPGQLQSVIVDTGSGYTAFPCSSCGEDCGEHIDPPFEPEASSTFSWVACTDSRCSSCSGQSCRYSVRYLEGSSISGLFFEDLIHFGFAERKNREARVWLGCHTEETHLFKTQKPSGIMGLGEDSWDVMEAMAEGPLEKQILALCFAEKGGSMTLGGLNETWTPVLAPLQWVPFTKGYWAEVQQVQLGAASVLSSVGKFMFDSGTTFTYFTRGQDSALRASVKSACEAGACGNAKMTSSSCWNVDDSDLDAFPDMTFTFEGASYVWPARGYLYRMQPSQSEWCFSFFGEPPLTLGASFMMHHLVVFDRDRRQIGFAPATCPEIGERSASVPGDGTVATNLLTEHHLGVSDPPASEAASLFLHTLWLLFAVSVREFGT